VQLSAGADLVLMDIDIGKRIDGTETARRILKNKNIPVVFLTSHAEREMVERVRGITRYGYIIKNSGDFVLQSSIEMAFELFEAHEKTSESEARQRTLIHTVPDLIWLKDENGVYLACNHAFEQFFGATEATIVGGTDSDFVDKELADFFREHDCIAMDAGKPSINEEWITFASDGHRALLETIKTPMFESDGRLIGVLVIGRDITERKRAEEALRENEILFRTLADSGMALIGTAGIDKKCDYFSQPWLSFILSIIFLL
jgi:PAS domain S-box-containing protein